METRINALLPYIKIETRVVRRPIFLTPAPEHFAAFSVRHFIGIFFFKSSTVVVSKIVSVNEETGTSLLTSHHPLPGNEKRKADKELAFALFYTGEPVK